MSVENKAWAKEVAKAFKEDFDHTHVHEYAHWENETVQPNMEKELQRIIDYAQKLERYVIFAKSYGGLLALIGIQSNELKPFACMIVGVAGELSRRTNYPIENLLRNYSTHTLFVQKENDPAFSSTELNELVAIEKATHAKVVKLPGKDHAYTDIKKLHELMESFLQGLVD